MKDRPVKQSPELDRVEQSMRPLYLCADGFLGNDPRKLIEILTEDQGTVTSLGLSHEVIAERLRSITRRARGGWGDRVMVEDTFEV